MNLMTARDFLETALANPSGYMLTFGEKKTAVQFRLNCYQIRSRKRSKNERAFIDEPNYIPHTEYDRLKLAVREDQGAWLLVATHIDFHLEHTTHRALTPEQLARFLNGESILEEGETIEVGKEPSVEQELPVENGPSIP